MNCPMCGEPWDLDRCLTCGWSERLDTVNRRRIEQSEKLLREAAALKVPIVLDAITDVVLAYRPKARSKPAVQRKRRRTILQNQKKRKR